ncbi:hypothetical protein OE88DRAFT_1661563 [Heliocybe sulcata]|uniref:Uncharacterized protein n=1 Tax=Heliocybe sulcata TaxID=5364 RepID=A0A5C3MYE5_9AGAM|nr:hypothetical protein OE88DRAFT_1661563 [Heliocybe sulcata]
MLRLGVFCFLIYSLISQVHSFIILNPSPSLYWISNNTNSSGVAYSGANYIRFLRNETDPIDDNLSAVLINSTGNWVEHWVDLTTYIRGPPGVYYTDVVSPGQWDIFVGDNAVTGVYTLALVNITAWANSPNTPLAPGILLYQSPSFNIYKAPQTTMQPVNNCSLAGGAATWKASATLESLDTSSQCPPNATQTQSLASSPSSTVTKHANNTAQSDVPTSAAARSVLGFVSLVGVGAGSLSLLLAL